MLKRQNIKLNSSGKVSCLLLLLLAFLLINPATIAVSALEGENNDTIPTPLDEMSSQNNEIEPLADFTSSINIAFSPSSGSASLMPFNTVGQSAQINVLATVNVKNSGGYSVYVKGSSQNLVGKRDSSNIVPGVTGTTTYSNLPVNTWGYYAKEGDAIPENATYKAITTSGNGDKITENTNTRISADTKTIALSFATKINDQKPADTYQNTITLSVVSDPVQLTINDITDMQDMTSDVCNNSKVLETKQLRDTRDNKYYWVTKLADNGCWMTQNLALDLSTSTPLTPATSDVASNWTPKFSTATSATNSTILKDNTGQRSWNLGSYYITKPNGTTTCGSKHNSLADCKSFFTALATPTSANGNANAHWLAGNYYQWNAATAGSGGEISKGQAESSICPKGWRLPEGGENITTPGSFGSLLKAYSIKNGDAESMAKIVSAPIYLVRAGNVAQDANSLLFAAALGGDYWSSTPDSEPDKAYTLSISYAVNVTLSSSWERHGGFSVRCVAR